MTNENIKNDEVTALVNPPQSDWPYDEDEPLLPGVDWPVELRRETDKAMTELLVLGWKSAQEQMPDLFSANDNGGSDDAA